MKKKGVLLVSPIGEIGGAEQVFLKIAQHLPYYGFNPVFACLRPGPLVERAKQQGLPVHVFREHRLRQAFTVMQGIRWLTDLVREVDADMIHSNYAAHLYAFFASRTTGVPEIWHIHDYPDTPDAIDGLQTRLRSQYVIFTTERVKSGYPQIDARWHSVVPPTCVDPNYLRSLPQNSEIRHRYHIPEGPLFLTVARLQKHKGHQYLLSAIPSVLKHYPNATFAIIGKAGDAEQREYQEKLGTQCKELGISDHVLFLGYVSDEEIVSLFREAKALVHPALSEGYGLTLLEAMALGVPVIAAEADGPTEIITHGANGLLVPRRDSVRLAEAILRLMEDDDLAKMLSEHGLRFVEQKSIVSMVKQTVDIYHQVASVERGKARCL